MGEPSGRRKLTFAPRFTISRTNPRLDRLPDPTGGAGRGDPGEGLSRGLTTHIAIATEDLEAACARLAEYGVELAGGPMPRGDGYQQVFFLDPDGYVLELFQYTGEDQSDAPPREAITFG